MRLSEAKAILKSNNYLLEKNDIKTIAAFNCKNIEFPGGWIDNLAELVEEFSFAGDDDSNGMKDLYDDVCEYNCVKEMNIKMLGLSKVYVEKTDSIRDVMVYDVFGYRVWQKIDDETIYSRIWHVEKL